MPLDQITNSNTKNKVFTIEHTVYFNETNAVGGVVYFSNYVKWQGMAREEYFIQTVPSWQEIMNYVISGQLNMITVEEHSHFVQHAFFGDQISIRLQTTNIRKYSFDMVFFISNSKTGQLLYEGTQKLAFDDFKGKFIEIPQEMLKSVKEHRIPEDDLQFCRLNKYFLRE